MAKRTDWHWSRHSSGVLAGTENRVVTYCSKLGRDVRSCRITPYPVMTDPVFELSLDLEHSSILGCSYCEECKRKIMLEFEISDRDLVMKLIARQ